MGGGGDGGVSACTSGLACLLAATGTACGTCGGDGQSCCGSGNNGGAIVMGIPTVLIG